MNNFNENIEYAELMNPIRILISKAIKGNNITEKQENDIFSYLRHIPNATKTDEEFELYCKMAKEKGLPEPDRNSKIRPLHEK